MFTSTSQIARNSIQKSPLILLLTSIKRGKMRVKQPNIIIKNTRTNMKEQNINKTHAGSEYLWWQQSMFEKYRGMEMVMH